LRSSRGQLTVMVLALGFLFLVRGQRLKRLESGFLILGLLLTILVAPLITEYRNYRILVQSRNISEALDWSMKGGFTERTSIKDTFISGLRFVLVRITGIEMLISYASLDVTPLGTDVLRVLKSPRGMAGYVTVDLLGVPIEANTSAAVSLPGWFYLIGGGWFMAVGIFLYSAFVWALWICMRKLRMRARPVAQALFLLWVYSVTVEGTLDQQVFSFITMMLSIVVCEWLIKNFGNAFNKKRTLVMKPVNL
jgi:hypothetical protein